MKLLLTGYCARSHAIIERLAADSRVEKIYWAPGNAGRVSEKVTTVSIEATDGPALTAFARDKGIDFTIVSQNFAIYSGAGNAFREAGLPVYGPTKEMAALEWDKFWAKNFFVENGIPSPAFTLLSDPQEIEAHARSVALPVVVKYGGLAHGGGVFLCHTRHEVHNAVRQIMNNAIRAVSGREGAVIFEQYVAGREVSMHFMVAGTTSVFVGDARDYKRSADGDAGTNTAGMGSYAPSGFITPDRVREVQERIIAPTIAGMQALGRPYQGVLYAGVMFTAEGPMLLEYNCRFGDSECQVLLGRLDANLLDLFLADDLTNVPVAFKNRACVTVCLCTEGYPADAGPQVHVIDGLDEVDADVTVFHYKTKSSPDGVLTSAGRVLSVTADAETRQAAAEKVYENIARISWPGMRCRKDVGR